jgi:hypothetical protein
MSNIVVADAGPLHYLILIDCGEILGSLFDHVLVPFAVRDELMHRHAPEKVTTWMVESRPWLEITPLVGPQFVRGLHKGEAEALQLALERHADAVLMDDMDGRAAGRHKRRGTLQARLVQRNYELTICHELGHVHLLGDQRITHDCDDSEPLTDLLTVFFGAGIFTANSAFEFHQWQDHSHQGWSASRLGYLSEEMFGYTLGCYSWYRGELSPPWARYLRENIRYYFDESLHFLSKTRQTAISFNGAPA